MRIFVSLGETKLGLWWPQETRGQSIKPPDPLKQVSLIGDPPALSWGPKGLHVREGKPEETPWAPKATGKVVSAEES